MLHAALKLEYVASVEKNWKDCSLKVVHCEKYMLKMVSSLCPMPVMFRRAVLHIIGIFNGPIAFRRSTEYTALV